MAEKLKDAYNNTITKANDVLGRTPFGKHPWKILVIGALGLWFTGGYRLFTDPIYRGVGYEPTRGKSSLEQLAESSRKVSQRYPTIDNMIDNTINKNKYLGNKTGTKKAMNPKGPYTTTRDVVSYDFDQDGIAEQYEVKGRAPKSNAILPMDYPVVFANDIDGDGNPEYFLESKKGNIQIDEGLYTHLAARKPIHLKENFLYDGNIMIHLSNDEKQYLKKYAK